MIKEFIENLLPTLVMWDILAFIYFLCYAVKHGIKYHMIVVVSIVTGRGYTSDTLTKTLNIFWYISIVYLLYNFV